MPKDSRETTAATTTKATTTDTHDEIKVTELELKILQCIWQLDNLASVNQILEQWPESDKPGYTTVLKTLQKMEVKSQVGHEKQGKQHAYFAKHSQEDVTQSRLSHMISRLFSGNKLSFAEYFLKSADFEAGELQELKSLIQEKEKQERKNQKQH